MIGSGFTILTGCQNDKTRQLQKELLQEADSLVWGWQGTIKTSLTHRLEAYYSGGLKLVRTSPLPFKAMVFPDVKMERESLMSPWHLEQVYYSRTILPQLQAAYVEVAVPEEFVVAASAQAPKAFCRRPFKIWFKCWYKGKLHFSKNLDWEVPKVNRIRVDGGSVWLFDSIAVAKEFAPGTVVTQILPVFPI